MPRCISHQVLSPLFLAVVVLALLPTGAPTAAAAEVVVARWTSPGAESVGPSA